MSIRWKIVLLCIALSLLPIAFLNNYTVRVFDEFTRKMLEEQMIDYAHVIGDDYRRQITAGEADPDFAQRLQRYHAQFGARLQIVGTDGRLLYDSVAKPETGRDMSTHRDVQKALAGQYGACTALNDDRSLLYYYVALPIRSTDGEVLGVACVQAHTQAITKAILGMVRNYHITMAFVLGAAVLAAILLSYPLTRRLRILTRAVGSFARGESLLDLNVHGRDEIGALARACERLAAEIRQINTRQQDLLATTTHELKTPLTAIKGAVQVLHDDAAANDPTTRARFLANIDISASRLLSMVVQLAALSKLKSEELRGKKERVQYGVFVREVIERLYPHPATGIALELPESEVSVLMIPERIEQVLANLIGNALRYTPADGQITIRVKPEGGMLITRVTDTGTGIEPSDLPRVFEQFFTTVPRNGLTNYGSGLGLAISRSIVQNHGGDIQVESTPGKGSVFTFTLPL